MENGKLDAITIEDEIPANLEFVQGSERAEGTEQISRVKSREW